MACFLNFNVFNYLGAVFAGHFQWLGGTSVRSQASVAALCLLRAAFIPAFMMCNLSPSDRSMEV